MTAPTHVRALMVEFHRLGGAPGFLAKGTRYILTCGGDTPAQEITMDLDHRDFMKYLHRLRYSSNTTPAQIEEALGTLSASAARMLPDLSGSQSPDETIQVDLVAGAAELWAFPFEASTQDGQPTFARGDRRVVLTRRIRGDFKDKAQAWPATPRVLFVHASIAPDLDRDFVDGHYDALEHALSAWKRGKKSWGTLLAKQELFGLSDLTDVRATADFTHIHILAHGQDIPDDEVPGEVRWGLRLGGPGGLVVSPEELAAALQPRDGLPVVITLAVCDSGNQSNPTIPTYSLAQELHRRGVPIVVASQLPLTKAGSTLLARHFYEPLLRGDDARDALHDVRVKLRDAQDAGRDWVGLVGYVRLPEGYADHLTQTSLRIELALLDAAQARADALNEGGTADEFLEVEGLLRARIASLESRQGELVSDTQGVRQENEGLLASAHKRLAELLFNLSQTGGPKVDEWRTASRQALDAARGHYGAAFRSDTSKHWQGVQQLALDAILDGAVDPMVWTAVLLAAQYDTTYWAQGTLAEVHLLAPLAGRAHELDAARDAITRLKEMVPANESFPLASTRRQLSRYVRWWTKAHGFFAGQDDLAQDANELVKLLD